MKFSIVIPFHSNKNLLQTCIESILKTVNSDIEIIVVANNQNSDEINIALPNKCKVIKYDKALYYPKAINLGAEISCGEFLVLIDSDIIVCEGWLENLHRCFTENINVGGCSCKMIDPFDSSIKEFGIGFTGYNFPHPFAGLHYQDDLVSNNMKVQAFCSAASLYERKTFITLGGMDERLIDGYSDIDLCLRLHEINLDTYVVASSLAYHLGSSTNGNIMSSSLRADTKGVFMASKGKNCKVDMCEYFKVSFAKFKKCLKETYFLIDFTTTGDKLWHHELFQRFGHLTFSSIYHFPMKTRNAKHIPLYFLLDDNIRRRPEPICFFVDSFKSLKNNDIWAKLRNCENDLVIDRNANIFSLIEVL